MIARKQFTSRYVIRLLVVCLALLTGFLIRGGTNHIRAETSAPLEKELVVHNFGLNYKDQRARNDGLAKNVGLIDPIANSQFIAYDVTDVYRDLVYQKQNAAQINENLLSLQEATLDQKPHYKLPQTDAAGLARIMLPERSVASYQDQTKAVYLVKAPGTDKKAILNQNLPQEEAAFHLYFADYYGMKKVQFNSVYYDYEQGKYLPAVNEYLLERAAGEWYQGVDEHNRPIYTQNKAEAYKFTADANGYISAELPWAAMGATVHHFRVYKLQAGLHEANARPLLQIHNDGVDNFKYRSTDELGNSIDTSATEVPNVILYTVPTPKISSDFEEIKNDDPFTFKVQMPLPLDIMSQSDKQLVVKIGSGLALCSDPEVLKIVVKDKTGQKKYSVNGRVQSLEEGQNGFKLDFSTNSIFKDVARGDYLEVEYRAKEADSQATKNADITTEVSYDNNYEDKTTTYTPRIIGAVIQKLNSRLDALPGAEFVLYRLKGDTREYYMPDASWSSSATPDQAKKYVSGEEGMIYIIDEPNMPEGIYYFKEVKAPPGYMLLPNDVALRFLEYTYRQTKVQPQNIKNFKEPTRPEFVVPVTGGNGVIWLLSGSILLIMAVGIYFKKRKID
ncbi:prealbumin-like fold domain-containing protein [Lactobacillus sp. CC-MHH1034]|uniref:SpaA isopeptide-forming pilin-related protein n=1 Tax=Agrilactobacillus fermenti TaxID=2586909 RepID=UPI001E6110A7|nr:SpaA isopeptide-forming pilin-related protein [Agrilactobacillus fermenti]MCD2256505.1 prealbumin-like fold domain-containing protein [Agrilactobacillus fermenti]